MSVIEYTAKRGLVAGHTVDTVYKIEFGIATHNERMNIVNTKHKALDGTTETTLHRIEDSINISTGFLTEALNAEITEFLKSCAAGETFTFDRFGTTATPSDPITCELTTKSNTARRVAKTDTFKRSFIIKVV